MAEGWPGTGRIAWPLAAQSERAYLPTTRRGLAFPLVPLRPQQRRRPVEVIVAQAVEVLVVAADEVVDAFGRDLDDPGGEPAHEPAVVGDEEQGARVAQEAVDQRLDRFQVEVVGRLVEDQDVGLEDDVAAEQEARGFAASSLENRTAASWPRTKPIGSPGQQSQSQLWTVFFSAPWESSNCCRWSWAK